VILTSNHEIGEKNHSVCTYLVRIYPIPSDHMAAVLASLLPSLTEC
jgi:hypothetical protein